MLFCIVSTDAIAASAPGPPETAAVAQPSGVRKIDYDAATGVLGVEAAAADLGELLGKIARKSNVTIELGAGISKKVSVNFSNLPFQQGINAIVVAAGESNLVAEYTKKPGDTAGSFRLEKIVLLRKGQVAGAIGNAGGARLVAGQDRGALAELLRQYEDPKTTRDDKLKLRGAIRRSAGTPQEKAQLKEAVLDTRNRGHVAEDLQYALAQSMREHPEGSDKAYVIELMRRESASGSLVKAMVGSGDPAYVNYLLAAAQAQDLHAIELIGDLRIAQAAPVLEKLAAGPDTRSAARQAAGMALRQLGVPPEDRRGNVQVSEESLSR